MTASIPLVISLVALAIPAFVVVIVCLVARREGRPVPTAALTRLIVATVVAVAAALIIDSPLAVLGLSLALFVVFGIPVTRKLETAVTPVRESIRSASLEPRRAGAYVPFGLRALSIVVLLVAASGTALRALATEARLPMMFMTCTFAAVAFFGLYEAWMHQEAVSVRAKEEGERRRRVRAVFAGQNILAVLFLVLAVLCIDLPRASTAITAAAGLIGAAGCALALSTGVQERYLAIWSVRE